MDPMIDLDRELARATQVDPSPDFTARVRARIGEAPRPSRWTLPGLALATASALAIGVLASTLVSQPPVRHAPSALLEHHELAVVVPLRIAAPSWRPLPPDPVSVTITEPNAVIVSHSEMLALQRLFSGEIVAPPAAVIADELSIPQLAIDAISWPILEGDQQ